MSIETATFVVQRGDEQFSCLGSELKDKLQSEDMMIVQRGSEHKKWMWKTKFNWLKGIYELTNTDLNPGVSSQCPGKYCPRLDIASTADKKPASSSWQTAVNSGYDMANIICIHLDSSTHKLLTPGTPFSWDFSDWNKTDDWPFKFKQKFDGIIADVVVSNGTYPVLAFTESCHIDGYVYDNFNVDDSTGYPGINTGPYAIDPDTGALIWTGVYYNFVATELDQLDILQPDDLFIVTDEDNGHKSVTGAQVKELIY